jgi:hypothetical protein
MFEREFLPPKIFIGSSPGAVEFGTLTLVSR